MIRDRGASRRSSEQIQSLSTPYTTGKCYRRFSDNYINYTFNVIRLFAKITFVPRGCFAPQV